MEPDFSISKPDEQKYVLQFCKDLRAQEGNFIVKDTTDCWFEDFVQYLIENWINFPVQDEE